MSQLEVKRELVLSTTTAQYIANGDQWSEYYLDFLGKGFAKALSRVGTLELRTLLLALDIIAREDGTNGPDTFCEDLVDAAYRVLNDRGTCDPVTSGVPYGE